MSSNDDFEARFSLRGADFSRIGVYLDGVELHNPLHTVEDDGAVGSASAFNSDLVEGITLFDDAFPERFSDSTAGAIDVRTRDGNRDAYSFRISANFANAGFLAEGPFGRFNRCSWIGGFRKSYLQYLLNKTMQDPTMAFGIEDGQARLSCRVSATNTVSLDVVDSYTNLDRTNVQNKLGLNSLMLAGMRFSVGNLGWHYTPSDKLMITSHAAWMRDNFDDQNSRLVPLGNGN